MAKRSVLTDDLEHCIICGKSPAQLHHVFSGEHINRVYAEEDGFIIPLCWMHHTGDWKRSVHGNPALGLKFKRMAQWKYEETHTRDEFRKRYGKSYL